MERIPHDTYGSEPVQPVRLWTRDHTHACRCGVRWTCSRPGECQGHELCGPCEAQERATFAAWCELNDYRRLSAAQE